MAKAVELEDDLESNTNTNKIPLVNHRVKQRNDNNNNNKNNKKH